MSNAEARPFDRLRLRNVRCFRDAEIPLDPHATIIVGTNGAGKTTLIEALASLSAGEDEGLSAFPLRRKARAGEIALYETGSKRPAARWVAGQPRRRLPEERSVFAYGRYRRVFTQEEEPETERAVSDPAVLLDQLAHHAGERRTVTLNRPDNNLLRDLSRYLVALDFGRVSDPRLETIWKQLNQSLPELESGLSEIQMEAREFGKVPMIVRRGLPLELRELSDGYQALLVVIFDLMLRYAYLFTGDNPLVGQALVAIDEIDLHLHPCWQRTVVKQLLKLFPKTQFVLTTHSPIVVQGAIDRQRAIVTLQEKDGEVVPSRIGKRVMEHLKGAEVGSVLLENRLFGVRSRYSTEYAKIEKRVDELQTRVGKGRATEDEYRELSDNISRLQELVAKEDERRADGSTVAQMSRLQTAFVKELVTELRKARS